MTWLSYPEGAPPPECPRTHAGASIEGKGGGSCVGTSLEGWREVSDRQNATAPGDLTNVPPPGIRRKSLAVVEVWPSGAGGAEHAAFRAAAGPSWARDTGQGGDLPFATEPD